MELVFSWKLEIEFKRRDAMNKYMKKKWLIILGLVFLGGIGFIISPELIRADPGNMNQAEFVAYLDEEIIRLQNKYQIPGLSLNLIKGGEVVKAQAYGYSDLSEKRTLTLDTTFRVQSISKSLTAWGIMNLVEEGLLHLDRPFVSYLNSWEIPTTKYPLEEVTVRQLLSMTGGLQLGTIGVRYSPEEELPSLKRSLSQEVVMRQPPGQNFYYSNVSFNLLELLVEEVTGDSFASYMQREIFQPLGMDNSTFVWSRDITPPVSTGYDLQGKSVPVYIYPEKASGGLFSTGEDITTFLSYGMVELYAKEQSILSRESIEEMHQSATSVPGFYGLAFEAYGFGHYLENLPGGLKAVSHGGQGYGVMTHYHLLPETGDAIIILTNSQRSWPAIAQLLRIWTEWLGVGSVGMSRIITGGFALKIIIWLVFLIALARLGALAIALKRGEYRLIFNWYSNLRRFFAIIIFTGLFLAARQDYLFLTSVFPLLSVWLGYALAGLGVVLLF